MACKIEKTTNVRLQSLIDSHGQEQGLRMFLADTLESKGLNETSKDAKTRILKYVQANVSGFIRKESEDIARKEVFKYNNLVGYKALSLNPTQSNSFTIAVLKKEDNSYKSVGLQSEEDNYSKLIQQLNNRRINIFNTLAKEKDKLKIEGLKEKVALIDEQLILLEKEKTIESIKTIFDNQYSWLTSMLNQEVITLSDLNLIKQFIGGWKGMKEMFLSEDLYDNFENNTTLQINDIENKVNSLNLKWNNKLGKSIFNEVKNKSKRVLQDSDYERVIKIIKDAGFLESSLYDASAIDNIILQVLNKVTTDSNKTVENSYKNIINNVKELYNNLQKQGIKDFNWLLQKDKNGEVTGNFVNRFSTVYYNTTKELSNKYNLAYKNFKNNPKVINKKKLDSVLNERRKWYKENTVSIDFRYLSFSDYQGITEDDKLKYKEYLTNQYGLERTLELIEMSEKAYDSYLENKQQYIDYQDTELSLNNIDQDKYTKNIENWDLEYNPIYYLQYLSGNQTEASLKHIKTKAKYVVTQPKMFNDNGSQTEWYDKDYIELNNNPAKKAYYDYVKSTIQSLTKELPSYITDDLNSGFIPVIKAELNEAFSKNGIKGFLKEFSQEFIDKYLITENDYQSKLIDPNTGEALKSAKINFVNKNSTPIEARSFDMNTIIQSYAMMALNYKNKTDIEDFINLSIDVLKTAQVDKDLKQNPQNLVKMAEYLRDYHIYSERYNEKEFVSKTKTYKTKEEKTRASILKQEMDNLESLIENEKDENNKQLLLKQYKDKSEEYKKLGGFVSYSKIIQEAMYLQTLKAFAFNPFTAFANLSFGLISNLTFASGGEYVNNGNMTKAFGIMLNATRNIINGNKTATKISSLMDKLQIEAKVGDLDTLSKTVTQNFWKDLTHKYPFALMKSTDYFMRGQLLVGMMINKKVTDLKGVERSIWEAFDDNGQWKIDEFGEEIDLTDFRNTAQQVQKRVHGNQDKQNSPILLNKNVLGRLIGQFRASWVFEGFRSRFQGEQFDEQLGDYTKGRYTSLVEGGAVKNIAKTIFINQFKFIFDRKIYNDLSDIDKANMKRNLTELYVYETMLMLGLLLKGLYDDDDDKDSTYKITMNLLRRSQDDILFYVSPTAFENIVKNPVPAFKVITDLTNAGHATYKYMSDEDYDTEKVMRKYTNILPGTNIYNKVTTWSEREF